ncbi:MAG TPA: GNAT family N-acetyltransferase [Roseiflexaceae bacterium]|nr:GNAT family N-acetyltransferase [Roseiflexaceae bacterium]
MPDMSHSAMRIALLDGRELTLRPLDAGESVALYTFGCSLPDDDWLYLQNDLRSLDTTTRLANARGAEHWRQLVAADDSGNIAAYASARKLPGRSSHVVNIQLIVSAGWRHIGLGSAMAHAIVTAARELGGEKVTVEMIEEQSDGRAIFDHLGFVTEGTLTGFARGRDGHHYNVLVMASQL